MSAKPRPELAELLKYVGAKLLLLVLLAALAVSLPVLLPMLLLGLFISERLRHCPNCGRRGTLRDVTPPRPSVPEDEGEGGWAKQDLYISRPRIVVTRVWRCQACGASFEGRGEEPLRRVAEDGPSA